MFDAIPNARWELLDGARHMTFVDNTAQYCQILNDWMSKND